ncbi:MAG: hypothetical protein M0Z52_04425 [Actinomycetota bacterium]|nr:hypothetical protein [Actinomycetota bacterium]
MDCLRCEKISRDDLREALRAMENYIDITEEDLLLIYEKAYEICKRKMAGGTISGLGDLK